MLILSYLLHCHWNTAPVRARYTNIKEQKLTTNSFPWIKKQSQLQKQRRLHSFLQRSMSFKKTMRDIKLEIDNHLPIIITIQWDWVQVFPLFAIPTTTEQLTKAENGRETHLKWLKLLIWYPSAIKSLVLRIRLYTFNFYLVRHRDSSLIMNILITFRSIQPSVFIAD